MRIRIKLMGTLPAHFPGRYPVSGIEIDLPAGATVQDLVTQIGIPTARLGFITVNGRLAKAAEMIPENATIKIFQKIAGG